MRLACSVKGHWVSSRDHNTKKVKLSIDVCAMFVAAKVIFSTFVRARAQTIEFAFLTCAQTGPFALKL